MKLVVEQGVLALDANVKDRNVCSNGPYIFVQGDVMCGIEE